MQLNEIEDVQDRNTVLKNQKYILYIEFSTRLVGIICLFGAAIGYRLTYPAIKAYIAEYFIWAMVFIFSLFSVLKFGAEEKISYIRKKNDKDKYTP